MHRESGTRLTAGDLYVTAPFILFYFACLFFLEREILCFLALRGLSPSCSCAASDLESALVLEALAPFRVECDVEATVRAPQMFPAPGLPSLLGL